MFEKYIAIWKQHKIPKTCSGKEELAKKLGYKYVGMGSCRIVYLAPDNSHVVKFEIEDSNYPHQNAREHKVYNKYKGKKFAMVYANGKKVRRSIPQFAECTLVNNIIFMEAVEVLYYKYSEKARGYSYFRKNNMIKLPKWAYHSNLDGGQVGINKNNKIVVYDYGWNTTGECT